MDYNDQMNAQRAETFRLSGAYEQAIKIFKELQSKYPDNAWVNAHLGTTYYQLLNYNEAEIYLKKAIEKNDKYFWAQAQLGETYRQLAIINERKPSYVRDAIKHFTIALGADSPEQSNYAWALAHLGATYRMKLFVKPDNSNIDNLKKNSVNLRKILIYEDSKEKALDCLNRALEIIPTYAWAWGMRATVYRLTQEYKDAYWDLEVETVISPEIGVLQNSPCPVPFLETRRINLHEHAMLCFYLTKFTKNSEKQRQYARAIAFAQNALIHQPFDLIALLILTIIEGTQKKEEKGHLDQDDIEEIKIKVGQLFEDVLSELSAILQNLLRNIIVVKRFTFNKLERIAKIAGEEHKLTKLVLDDVIA
ncbi:MAG: tetratricopeptide repeat protein, partial [Moorea sp. SIO4G2]|nr:tetratricopeptide repeat protein [Moorena sp. SIO4G2]